MPLLSLPNELLLLIAKDIRCRRDITSLLKICRRINNLLTSVFLRVLVKSEQNPIIALYWGAATANEALVREIVNLSTGSVFIRDTDEPTWLHHFPGRIEPSEALITRILKKGPKIKMQAHNGKTALDYAVGAGKLRMVELLLGVMDSATSYRGRKRDIALGIARGHDVLALLLQTAHPHYRDTYGNTPLHLAVKICNKAVVNTLLEKGASITARNKQGQTPFQLAAELGIEPMVKLLVNTNPRAILRQAQRAVSLARRCEHRGIVKFLLYEAFHYSDVDMVYKRTPLHMAAEDHDEKLVIELLKRGASVSARDNNGKTPLHLAAKYEHKTIISQLIEHGADISAKDQNGKTALHIAAGCRVPQVVSMLLQEGADVNAQDRHGWTPLHIASQALDYGTACSPVLLENGASPVVEDDLGRKPRWRETFLSLVRKNTDAQLASKKTDMVALGLDN